ncbi:hypothetical protein Pint_26664 [Pistacia integerrima]|uniref:Uncharacterized protein n=1 Tax=Pistacia integerrima TaxID=434235 RepID=A0ACC0YMM8_9ROSI|nr:hypothetical protein Pint_26664 [Pistacia integerrima]
MASLFVLFVLSFFSISQTNAVTDLESLFSSTTTATPPSHQSPQSAPDVTDQTSFFSHTALLESILSHLGFNELATAAPCLSITADAASASTTWSGPSTLFAASDSSLRTCISCSIPSLLREHLIPGLFTTDYLRKLTFGTKIETLAPGRCVTITSTKHQNDTVSKLFVSGVEITHPDLFNNGLVIVHGIQGYISPLSPLSCDVERMTSLSFQNNDHHQNQINQDNHLFQNQPPIMRLMLRDAMLRLRNNGFSILSLAFKVKYPELVMLNNMTVFALDDVAIFSGSYTYISNIRFHIVPNHYLTVGELERLPVGTALPTLVRGESLVVTAAGGGVGVMAAPLRINYVRVKVPDVMRNLKIIIHGVYLPFPHLHHKADLYDHVARGAGGLGVSDGGDHFGEGACSAMKGQDGSCGLAPPVSKIDNKKPTVEIEDHHML